MHMRPVQLRILQRYIRYVKQGNIPPINFVGSGVISAKPLRSRPDRRPSKPLDSATLWLSLFFKKSFSLSLGSEKIALVSTPSRTYMYMPVVSLMLAKLLFVVCCLLTMLSLSTSDRRYGSDFVKKTTVYTHVNGDRPSHIENSKYKKSYFTILLHIDVRRCAVI